MNKHQLKLFNKFHHLVKLKLIYKIVKVNNNFDNLYLTVRKLWFQLEVKLEKVLEIIVLVPVWSNLKPNKQCNPKLNQKS